MMATCHYCHGTGELPDPPYHCTACRNWGGPVDNECCTCCQSHKERMECEHRDWVRRAAFADSPTEWQECVACGLQKDWP